MAQFFSLCLPSRKAGGLQIPCCQGIAVADYSFTLDALALKPSSFCNVGVTEFGFVFMERLAEIISQRLKNRTDKLVEGWSQAFDVNPNVA